MNGNKRVESILIGSKVSIIVPIYNGENYIDNCVNNLKKQTYGNLEFVLVDDGSTDKTPLKCDELAKGDSRFKVIHKANGGLSTARNAGIKASSGDYVYFYDVDDDIIPSLVEDNVRLAEEHNADVVMFGFWYHNLDTGEHKDNILGRGFVGNGEEFFDNYLQLAVDHEVFNAPWNKIYRRSFLDDNNLEFLPEYPIYEDIIFSVRMLKKAEKIVVNDNMYYVYYIRSAGSLITKYVDGYFDSVTYFYDNALDYCRLHADNSKQISKLSTLYVRLVTNNLKQISNNENLERATRIRLIRNICHNEKFRSALKLARLEPRKIFVKAFALTGNAYAVYRMYRFLSRHCR